MIPSGATVLEPRGTAPGPRGAAGRWPVPGPTVVVLPGPPSELQPMWEDAVAAEAFQARDRRGDRVPARDRAPVRDAGGGDREHAARRRRGRADARAARDHHLPAARRDRGRRRASSPTRRRDYDALLAFIAERHGEKLFSRDGTRSTSRSRSCCWRARDDRAGRVLYGRPACRPPDRAPGLIGVRDRRRRGLQQRGQDPIWSGSTRS